MFCLQAAAAQRYAAVDLRAADMLLSFSGGQLPCRKRCLSPDVSLQGMPMSPHGAPTPPATDSEGEDAELLAKAMPAKMVSISVQGLTSWPAVKIN